MCLHNRLHMPMTVAVLEAGKNCYCEKPMSWTYRDAKKMYEMCIRDRRDGLQAAAWLAERGLAR